MCLWRDGRSDGTSGPEGPGVPSGTSGEDPHSCCPLVLAVHPARCRMIDPQQS